MPQNPNWINWLLTLPVWKFNPCHWLKPCWLFQFVNLKKIYLIMSILQAKSWRKSYLTYWIKKIWFIFQVLVGKVTPFMWSLGFIFNRSFTNTFDALTGNPIYLIITQPQTDIWQIMNFLFSIDDMFWAV